MLATVSKWGNSLAIRIPRGIAEDARISEGVAIDIRAEEGRIVAEPVAPPTLEALVAGITPENMHTEQFGGQPVGNEVW